MVLVWFLLIMITSQSKLFSYGLYLTGPGLAAYYTTMLQLFFMLNTNITFKAIYPNQSNQTKLNQTKPNQTKPNCAKPNRTCNDPGYIVLLYTTLYRTTLLKTCVY